ncbi:biotin--[acetyl-CoA-carboxylase] ligase [Bacteroidota bacterium]
MNIITDSIKFASRYTYAGTAWKKFEVGTVPEITGLVDEIFPNVEQLYCSQTGGWEQETKGTGGWEQETKGTGALGKKSNNLWKYLFLVEHTEESQYDALIHLAQNSNLPDGIICIAGSGKKFHGFHSRKWVSLPGNIHLSAYLKPQQKIKNFGVGFLILSAVSVVMAIDEIEGLKGKASIKWVNDILIDKAKVCGVLAHTLAQGKEVTDAILGIGLNVESKPDVEPTLFVPVSACLNDFTNKHVNEKYVFKKLVCHLAENYKLFLKGHYKELLDFYRNRCSIIGRKVSVSTDERDGTSKEFHTGTITGIGEGLELRFDNLDKPITRGRLVLED